MILHACAIAGRKYVGMRHRLQILVDDDEALLVVHAEVARQVRSDGGEEIASVSVWRDFDAIYGWLGATNLLDMRMMDPGEQILGDFEVQHYEALDPDELVLPGVRVAGPVYADGGPAPATVGRLRS